MLGSSLHPSLGCKGASDAGTSGSGLHANVIPFRPRHRDISRASPYMGNRPLPTDTWRQRPRGANPSACSAMFAISWSTHRRAMPGPDQLSAGEDNHAGENCSGDQGQRQQGSPERLQRRQGGDQGARIVGRAHATIMAARCLRTGYRAQKRGSRRCRQGAACGA
jgi:hypothetical protein